MKKEKKEKKKKVVERDKAVELMAKSYTPYEVGGVLEDLLEEYKYFSSMVSNDYDRLLAKIRKEILFWSSVKELHEKQEKEVDKGLVETFSIIDSSAYDYYQDLYLKESKRVTKLAIYGFLTTLTIIFLLIDKIIL